MKANEEPSDLQINPSYGVFLSIPKNPKEITEENAEEEAKAATTKAAIHVNDREQTMTVVYANDPKQGKAIFEEYEYMDVSPTSTEQLQISKQQKPPYSELSADYEN